MDQHDHARDKEQHGGTNIHDVAGAHSNELRVIVLDEDDHVRRLSRASSPDMISPRSASMEFDQEHILNPPSTSNVHVARVPASTIIKRTLSVPMEFDRSIRSRALSPVLSPSGGSRSPSPRCVPNGVVEVCVDSVESAIRAYQGGATRLEVCSALSEGGLTPSFGLLRAIRLIIPIPIVVMIRPHGGEFVYSDAEIAAMKVDIEVARMSDAEGVVFGVLTNDFQVDKVLTRDLIDAARPLTVTFHRAFDMVADPFQALDDLMSVGVDRILTSGCAPSAAQGQDLIAKLIDRAAGRISLMPGGGISEANITPLLQSTGAKEIHLSARAKVFKDNTYPLPRPCPLRPSEISQYVCDGDLVARLVYVAAEAWKPVPA